MGGKSILLSKTFWLGAALASYGGFITYAEGFSSDPLVMMVAGILGIINRYLTTQPIK